MADDKGSADAALQEAAVADTPKADEPSTAAPEAAKKTTKKRSKRTKKVMPKAKRDGASASDDAPAGGDVPVLDTPEVDAEPEGDHGSSDTGEEGDAGREVDAEPSSEAVDSGGSGSGEGDEESAPKKPSRSRKRSSKKAESPSRASPRKKTGPRRMLINYVPGEECRVAIVENEQLDEYYAERSASINRVGNIYLGKVTNVESAIQAAFVDFGQGENAFLHVTDLHPRYFPSEDGDTVERIGKKTARSQRPPIQQCLKRGQKILVQVLKDGVGTKGPAVTSYLSIPGRYLVMMPNMDKVGVSRKVEDEDTRKKMKKQLDQLELPEGFGFILRTAGLDKTKTDLKRDLSYLQRLWKDMEKRQKKASKPTLLYAESDLLVRSLRDILTAEIDEIVVDDLAGVKRAANFLKIVSPRTSRNLLHYPEAAPIFHAYGIEDQLKMLHQRTVPLPSGGALVIDETEALVAIDVNSGKSRSAKDAETNAFETNKEACDMICRQLKLRELGGLVICDLIDMMQAKNRKAIEKQFKETLDRDKNRATILPISEFGILEMTRQRSQASHSQIHYQVSTEIKGRALFRKPESLASEALREVAAVASREKVEKVELVVPVKVAGELLTNRRRSISRLERRTGKPVDVRVSESFSHDRYVIYAYDENGNDLEVDRLPKIRPPKQLLAWSEIAEAEGIEYDWADDPEDLKVDPDAQADADMERELEEAAHPIEREHSGGNADDDNGGGKKKRRRKRRRRKGRGDGEEDASGTDRGTTDADGESGATPGDDADQETPEGAGGRGDASDEATDQSSGESDGEGGQKKRRRRRRRRRGKGEGESAGASEETPEDGASEDSTADVDESAEAGDDDASSYDAGDEGVVATKKRRRRRRRGSDEGGSDDGDSGGSASAKPAAPAPEVKPEPAKKKRRTLYGGSRRKLSASEKTSISDD